MSRFANKATSYSIYPCLFIDMTAKRDDGQYWELGAREDQESLEQMKQEHQPDLLIGSAPIPTRRKSKPRRCKMKRDNTCKRASKRTRDSRAWASASWFCACAPLVPTRNLATCSICSRLFGDRRAEASVPLPVAVLAVSLHLCTSGTVPRSHRMSQDPHHILGTQHLCHS